MWRFTKLFLLAIVASLAIHAMIVAYLGAQGGAGDTGRRETEAAGGSATEGRPDAVEGSKTARFLKDPVGMIHQRFEGFAGTAPEALEEKLAVQAERFRSIVSEDSVTAIRDVIARASGLEDEADAYEPDPQAVGTFDAGDFVLHDIRRNVDEAGRSSYEIVMVDRRGLTRNTKAETLSPEMHRVYRIFNLVREQPALRPLVKTAWRLADGLSDGGAESDPGK